MYLKLKNTVCKIFMS